MSSIEQVKKKENQQLIVTGVLGLLGTLAIAFRNKPEIYVLTTFETIMVAGTTVALTMFPEEKQVENKEEVSPTVQTEKVIPKFF